METEYQVLSYLHENETTTQRKISHSTGLSLGAVNLLVNKLVRKGFVKIEKLNARTMRYILTPQGLKEKTRLTYNYIRSSYRQIISVTAAVEKLLQNKQAAGQHEVIIYGPADEIEEILITTLHNMNLAPRIIRPENGGFKPEPKQIILTWRCEDEELFTSNQVYNIMNLI